MKGACKILGIEDIHQLQVEFLRMAGEIFGSSKRVWREFF
jgi:hypothetical protein